MPAGRSRPSTTSPATTVLPSTTSSPTTSKHNRRNGHDNTDGTADNLSWNCGWEGDDGVPADGRWRSANGRRRTFFCLLFLANGVPMFAAGDEFLQTHRGNNNPYNQDNETTLARLVRMKLHADHFRFVKLMIAFRKAHPSIGRAASGATTSDGTGSDRSVDLAMTRTASPIACAVHRMATATSTS